MKTLLDAELPACRAFLAGATTSTDDHAQACAACAARLRLRSGLAAALRTPPAPPAALRSPEFLAAVHERIVAQAERASAVVAALASPPRPAAPIDACEPTLAPALARAVASAPRASAFAWSGVRQAVIADIGERRALRRRASIWFGLASAAALAALLPLVLTPAEPPTLDIAFADLDTAPDGDFTVLRGGIPR